MKTLSSRSAYLLAARLEKAPISRFSATLIEENNCRPSGTRAKPRAALAWLGRCVTSSPSNVTLPRHGEIEPAIARKVVVYQLLATLKQLKDAGLTILLVEQNVHLALALSDYAYVVAEGRIFMEGLPKELVAKPEIRKAYLGL